SRRTVGPDGVDADRLLGREDAGEAVEIRLPRMIIVGVAYALDRLADLVARELERARAHDVLFVPVRILVEEHHGRRVGRLQLVDDGVVALARARNAFRRAYDLAPARRHVVGGEQRPVVEFHALADLERISLAIIGRRRHLRAEVADEVGA